MKILVIEDEVDVLSIYQDYADIIGVEIETQHLKNKVIDSIKSSKASVVIFDGSILNGMENECLGMAQEKGMKIIWASAWREKDVLGADAYLDKPFSFEKFQAVVLGMSESLEEAKKKKRVKSRQIKKWFTDFGFRPQGTLAFAPFYGRGDGSGSAATTPPYSTIGPNAPSPGPAYPGAGGINSPSVPAGAPNSGMGPVIASRDIGDVHFINEAVDFILSNKNSANRPKPLNESLDIFSSVDLKKLRKDWESDWSAASGESSMLEWLGLDDSASESEIQDALDREFEDMVSAFEQNFKGTANIDSISIEAFRCLGVDGAKDFIKSLEAKNKPKLGMYWSWDENAADCHWGKGKDKVVLVANIPISSINLHNTLLKNLSPNLGDDEREIEVKDGAKIELLSIKDLEGKTVKAWKKPLLATESICTINEAVGQILSKKKIINESYSQRQVDWAKKEVEGIAFYDISPMDFLKLTTKNKEEIDSIISQAKDASFYNQPKIQNDSIVHPFVYIDSDGNIDGHEGRHRAAASIKNGDEYFRIAIVAREDGWPASKHGWRWKRSLDVPSVLKGQFSSFSHKVDQSKVEKIKPLMSEARIRQVKIDGQEIGAVLMAGGPSFKIYSIPSGVLVDAFRKKHTFKEDHKDFKTIMKYVNLRYQPIADQEKIKQEFQGFLSDLKGKKDE